MWNSDHIFWISGVTYWQKHLRILQKPDITQITSCKDLKNHTLCAVNHKIAISYKFLHPSGIPILNLRCYFVKKIPAEVSKLTKVVFTHFHTALISKGSHQKKNYKISQIVKTPLTPPPPRLLCTWKVCNWFVGHYPLPTHIEVCTKKVWKTNY